MVELVAYRSYQERSSHEGAACRKGETSIDPLQYRRTPGSLSPCDTTRHDGGIRLSRKASVDTRHPKSAKRTNEQISRRQNDKDEEAT